MFFMERSFEVVFPQSHMLLTVVEERGDGEGKGSWVSYVKAEFLTQRDLLVSRKAPPLSSSQASVQEQGRWR